MNEPTVRQLQAINDMYQLMLVIRDFVPMTEEAKTKLDTCIAELENQFKEFLT